MASVNLQIFVQIGEKCICLLKTYHATHANLSRQREVTHPLRHRFSENHFSPLGKGEEKLDFSLNFKQIFHLNNLSEVVAIHLIHIYVAIYWKFCS